VFCIAIAFAMRPALEMKIDCIKSMFSVGRPLVSAKIKLWQRTIQDDEKNPLFHCNAFTIHRGKDSNSTMIVAFTATVVCTAETHRICAMCAFPSSAG
jgi:hypothetical protein